MRRPLLLLALAFTLLAAWIWRTSGIDRPSAAALEPQSTAPRPTSNASAEIAAASDPSVTSERANGRVAAIPTPPPAPRRPDGIEEGGAVELGDAAFARAYAGMDEPTLARQHERVERECERALEAELATRRRDGRFVLLPAPATPTEIDEWILEAPAGELARRRRITTADGERVELVRLPRIELEQLYERLDELRWLKSRTAANPSRP